MQSVRLDPADNVLTAIRSLAAGMPIEDTVTAGLIPSGHKIATQAILQGAPVYKYAQVIGYASCDIAPGEHVHTHNLEFRATDANYEFSAHSILGCEISPILLESKENEYGPY